MVRQQLFIGAALVAGAAIGFFAHPDGDVPKNAAVHDELPSAAKLVEDNDGDAATLAVLRARVAELEAKLARVESSSKADQFSGKVVEPSTPRSEGRHGDFRAHMEEMKKNDPVRYAQMTNRFAQMRNRQLERQQSKLDFLSSIDVSGMSSDAQKTHNDLQNAIVKLEELRDRMHQEDLSEDDRKAVFEEMRATERELRRLGATERDNLLLEVAKSVGLEGDALDETARLMSDIITATETTGFGRPPPGGRDPRGGK